MLFHRNLVQNTTLTTVNNDDHQYQVPTKLIKTQNDMKFWEKSSAYHEYLGFVLAINEAIKNKSNSTGSNQASTAIQSVCENLLVPLDRFIDEVPPIAGTDQRFGNKAFQKWYHKLNDEILVLLKGVLTEAHVRAMPEVMVYVQGAFGNSTRIDYGTGHEVAFVMFLYCLFKIGFLKEDDKVATGCLIFPKYLQVVRKLQQTYRLEPAGSQGVWSLDDFQFVPFIWGSSQLNGHPTIEPASILNEDTLAQYSDDYMFLGCIQYIMRVKTGPFFEHSNQLWHISGVPNWSKVNFGLIKMYRDHVLGKFPIVQHFQFGSLLTMKPAQSVEAPLGGFTSKFNLPMGGAGGGGSRPSQTFQKPPQSGDASHP